MSMVAWAVDLQVDFVEPEGALPIPNATDILPNVERLTLAAIDAVADGLTFVSTADWHTDDTREIREGEFPPHCMAWSDGADFVDEAWPMHTVTEDMSPEERAAMNTNYVLDYDGDGHDDYEAGVTYTLHKDEFSCFEGSPHTEPLLASLDPDDIVVWGVATDVCVAQAVDGMVERGYNVAVVTDAIKGLFIGEENTQAAEDNLLNSWVQRGVRLVTTDQALEMLA